MQITNRQANNYLLMGMAASLLAGYVLRAPELSETSQRQSEIRKEQSLAAMSRLDAISRAERCVVLMSELPITDGTAAYFSSLKNGRIVIDKTRPFPSGTTVCDQFGNTGIVAFDAEGNPIITDLQSMPPEEMEAVLKKRGVMPSNNSNRRFTNQKDGKN